MGVFRASIFWSSLDGEGWSENFFIDEPTIVAAQADMDTLIPQLAALRSAHWKIDFARVSDVAISGDSLPSSITMPVVGTYTPPLGAINLEANSAILIELFADSQTKGHWFLRGMTSAQIAGRILQSEATFDANLSMVATNISGGGFKVRSLNLPGPPPSYIYTTITAVFALRASARKPGRPFGVVRGRR